MRASAIAWFVFETSIIYTLYLVAVLFVYAFCISKFAYHQQAGNTPR